MPLPPHPPRPDSVGSPAALTPSTADDQERPRRIAAASVRRAHDLVVTLEMPLRALATRHLFHRDFDDLSRHLLALESSRTIHGVDPRVLQAAAESLADRAADARLALAQCEALLHGLRPMPANTPPPATLPPLLALLATPSVRVYLDLLRRADPLLHRIEQAGRIGLIDPPARARLAAACREPLLAYKDAVRQQRQIVRLHVRHLDTVARARRRELPDSRQGRVRRRPGAGAPDPFAPTG